jgi:hypothetical protein
MTILEFLLPLNDFSNMNPTLMAGTGIVTCALISYSLAVVTEQRKHLVTRFVLTFLTIGIILDITATVFMIIGSHNIPITVHGLLGYSALGAMLTDTILIWKFHRGPGGSGAVPRKLHLYTRIAYSWWVLAYLAGGVIAMIMVKR